MAVELRIAHTADLGAATLDATRAMLEAAFEGFEPEDWTHLLGGIHALVLDDGAPVGHGSVVLRRLLHGNRVLRAGYVEGVAVRADRRGHGHGARIMDALEPVVRRAYDLGALGSTDEGLGFYAARGWQTWRGPLAALTPDGLRPTPEEAGGILVLPCGRPLVLDGGLVCDWREGDVW